MTFLSGSYGIPLGFPCMSMIFLWDCYGMSIGFPWWFFGISIEFHKDVDRIPVGFLLDFREVSMAFLWYSYGISLVVL